MTSRQKKTLTALLEGVNKMPDPASRLGVLRWVTWTLRQLADTQVSAGSLLPWLLVELEKAKKVSKPTSRERELDRLEHGWASAN